MIVILSASRLRVCKKTNRIDPKVSFGWGTASAVPSGSLMALATEVLRSTPLLESTRTPLLALTYDVVGIRDP
jgi:hypothetical protein